MVNDNNKIPQLARGDQKQIPMHPVTKQMSKMAKNEQAVAEIQLGYGSMPPLQIGDRNTAKKWGRNTAQIREKYGRVAATVWVSAAG